jgi:hypothetical protein
VSLDLAAIHRALADQIEANIDSSTFTAKPYPSSVPRPCIEVWPDTEYIAFYASSGPNGLSDVMVVVRVFLSGGNDESEWNTAMGLLSQGTGFTSSVADAIMNDRTLGGSVSSCVVLNARWNPEDSTIDIPVAIQTFKQGADV